MVIDAALPQPSAVAITIPNTSPIAHPVRQCSVVQIASSRFMASGYDDMPRRRLTKSVEKELGCETDASTAVRPVNLSRKR